MGNFRTKLNPLTPLMTLPPFVTSIGYEQRQEQTAKDLSLVTSRLARALEPLLVGDSAWLTAGSAISDQSNSLNYQSA
jgi:hypothetical protein